jgi:N-acetylglutamate synthase-like GNAT family acetyltransferase
MTTIINEVFAITENKGTICADILGTLRQWFGAAGNAQYAREVEALPMFGVMKDGAVAGFLALKPHTPHAMEILVMGVRPEFHRTRLGHVLMVRAIEYAKESGVRYLTLKTLSASQPNEFYARTRKFYEAWGFVPIEEFPAPWNPDDPAWLMLKELS